jgi:phage shock protein PspC (stress-responsive transcriptional regulator)
MDENTTPPAGDTPPDPAPGPTYGPRVSAADIRDVSRLRRSVTDRHIAGVAGGLARHLDVDPILIRIGFVVATFFGGAGVILYGALWLLVPEEDEENAPIDLDPRSRGIAVVAAGVIAALAFLGDVLGGFGHDGDGFWIPLGPIVAIAVIAFIVVRKRERRRASYAAYGAPGAPAGPGVAPPWVATYAAGPATDLAADAKANPEKYRDVRAWKISGDPHTSFRWNRDPRKKGPLLFWIAIPLIALALGILGTADLAGTHVIPAAYPALALAVVAALLVLGSFWGRAGGLILLGLLLVPVTTVATVADHIEGKDVRVTPLSTSQIPADGYTSDVGKLVVDLTRLEDPQALDEKVVVSHIDVGELEIIVPDDVTVEAEAQIDGPGGIDLLGHAGGGIDISNSVTQAAGPDAPTWHIVGTADIGHVIVRSK